MIKHYFFLILVIFNFNLQGNECYISYTKNNEMVFFEEVVDSDIEQVKDLFIDIFTHTYSSAASKELGIDNLYEHFKNYFDKAIPQLRENNDENYFFSAKINSQLIGMVNFSLTNAHEVCIHIIGVDQNFKNQGVGKELVFLCLKKIPLIQKIIVETRKVNMASQAFYTKLGFKKQPAIYLDPKYFQGFVYSVIE